jgi:hypothetical protein
MGVFVEPAEIAARIVVGWGIYLVELYISWGGVCAHIWCTPS